MRILILNWKEPGQPGAGGAEEYVRRVGEAWVGEGHDLTLLVPASSAQAPVETRKGVRYLRMGGRLSVFGKARAHLRANPTAYDHVIDSVSTRPFLAHRLAGARSTALYHQVADDVWHHEFPFPLDHLGRRVVEPFWLRQMRDARVVAVSRSTKLDLARRGVPVIGVVPPGCDARVVQRESRPPGPPRLVFLGRMVAAKRPQDAVAAFELVRRSHPGSTLEMLGDGYLRPTLARRGTPGVSFHGWVSEAEKARILSGADLVLIPGTHEGWGIVAMEAAAAGAPAVAYDIPGLRDSVVEGQTGTLTPANPSSLATAAVALVEDQVRWLAYSRAGSRRAAEFTWERSARDLLRLVTENAGAA